MRASGMAAASSRYFCSTTARSMTRHGVGGCCSSRKRAILGFSSEETAASAGGSVDSINEVTAGLACSTKGRSRGPEVTLTSRLSGEGDALLGAQAHGVAGSGHRDAGDGAGLLGPVREDLFELFLVRPDLVVALADRPHELDNRLGHRRLE